MAASAPTLPQQPKSLPLSVLMSVLTRDQGDEYENITLNHQAALAATGVVSTPVSLRTDRKIKWIDIRWRGRFTNAATGPTLRTASPVFSALTNATSAVIFGILQQVTVRGVHTYYGNQQPIVMRGEIIAELAAIYNPNYYPWWTVSANGGAVTRFGALTVTLNQTNDIEFVLPIPTFPYGVGPNDQPFYCLHGPDWPGNIQMDFACNDGTCLATANPPTGPTAYGSASGQATIDIFTVRPLLGKDIMQWIRPSICFRQPFYNQPTQAVQVGGGSNQKLVDLTVGKDTTRIIVKVGTLASGGSGGVTQYGSYLDTVITRTLLYMDGRNLRFTVGATGDTMTNDYFARLLGRISFAGFRIIDLVEQAFLETVNPKAVFGSSGLTAARQFQVVADITVGGSNIAEVLQEMLLDAPAWQGPPIDNAS